MHQGYLVIICVYQYIGVLGTGEFFRQSTPEMEPQAGILVFDRETGVDSRKARQPKDVIRPTIPFGATGGREGLITTPRSVMSTRAAG